VAAFAAQESEPDPPVAGQGPDLTKPTSTFSHHASETSAEPRREGAGSRFDGTRCETLGVGAHIRLFLGTWAIPGNQKFVTTVISSVMPLGSTESFAERQKKEPDHSGRVMGPEQALGVSTSRSATGIWPGPGRFEKTRSRFIALLPSVDRQVFLMRRSPHQMAAPGNALRVAVDELLPLTSVTVIVMELPRQSWPWPMKSHRLRKNIGCVGPARAKRLPNHSHAGWIARSRTTNGTDRVLTL